jgi:hypothetical protein
VQMEIKLQGMVYPTNTTRRPCSFFIKYYMTRSSKVRTNGFHPENSWLDSTTGYYMLIVSIYMVKTMV